MSSKFSSTRPSYLPIPPQIKGRRDQSGNYEETEELRSLAVCFWRETRFPSDCSFISTVACTYSLGNKKLLQRVAAIVWVSLQSDILFFSLMKNYIYLTFAWLLINRHTLLFTYISYAFIQQSLSLPTALSFVITLNDHSAEFTKNQENCMTCHCLPEGWEGTPCKWYLEILLKQINVCNCFSPSNTFKCFILKNKFKIAYKGMMTGCPF